MIELELETVSMLSPTTREFRFRRLDGCAVEFAPGQFFRFVFVDAAGEFERSYSLCNQVDEDAASGYLVLVISVVQEGRASQLLFNSEPGLRARVSGPFGRLLLPQMLPDRLFLVATSVGIAPYLPMLTKLEADNSEGRTQVHFVYGTRDPGEFVYGDLLIDFAAHHDWFQLSVCYSREMPQDGAAAPGVSFHRGYVQERLLALAPDPATDTILLCGNPGMIDAAYAMLRERDFGPRQVKREKYVFAKEVRKVTSKPLSAAQQALLQEKMKKYQS